MYVANHRCALLYYELTRATCNDVHRLLYSTKEPQINQQSTVGGSTTHGEVPDLWPAKRFGKGWLARLELYRGYDVFPSSIEK